jgi:hypothetical protein
LKIYGDGEWKVRIHGVSKRCIWRKLHVGVNPKDGEIQVAFQTESNISTTGELKNCWGELRKHLFAADYTIFANLKKTIRADQRN